MSLITRCPACGTMFKVVPDQLRISEGWVRCGHCAEVFDASAHLQDPLAPAPEPTLTPTLDAPTVPGELTQAAEVPVDAAAPNPSPVAKLALDEPAWVHGDMPSLPVEVPVDTSQVSEIVVIPEAESIPLVDLPGPVLARPSAPVPLSDDDAAEEEVALHDVPFVRAARRKAFWRRPLMRSVLGLLLLVLLAALTLQVAVHERDRLAELRPELRPWLLALCEPLHCTLQPPRQIEAVVIEGSTFTRLRPDTYRLAFTLKNQGAMAIAMPAIELTLTDGQDQTVVRRVLTPAEMGAGTGVMAGGGEWVGAIAMAVAPGNSTGRVVGYRVLAFYP